MTNRRIQFSPDLSTAIAPLADFPVNVFAKLCDKLDREINEKVQTEDEVRSVLDNFIGSDECDGLELGRLDDLAEAIVGIHMIHVSSRETADEVVRRLVDNYLSADGSDASKSKALQENIAKLLGIVPLRRAALAVDLLNDRDNLYLDCRIISNIRPIPSGEDESQFYGSLITHSLKITYRGEDNPVNAYYSLDTADLHQLERAVQKAIKGAVAINEELRRLGDSPLLKTIMLPNGDDNA